MYNHLRYIIGTVLLFCTAAAGAQLTSTNLPIILITTPGSITATQSAATIKIVDNAVGPNTPASPAKFSGSIGIRVRGSLLVPKPSYNVETWGAVPGNAMDTALLGMPSENDWVLLSMYPDRSLMRTLLGLHMYGVMDPDFYAPRMRLCEVMLNGAYKGVYLFGERIKRDDERLDITKLNLGDGSGIPLTGGYIVKIDESNDAGWNSIYSPPGATSSQVIRFHYDDPDESTITGVQKAYIKGYIDSFENALSGTAFADTNLGWRRYASRRWFESYLIINEVLGNEEAYRKNTYLYKDRAKKLRIGPPGGLEQSLYNTTDCFAATDTAWMYRHGSYCPADTYLPPFWWARLLQDNLYVQDMKCQYTVLRKYDWDTVKIFAYMDSVASYLTVGAAAGRNFTQWPVFGVPLQNEPAPMAADFAGEIAAVKGYLRRRLAFLDAQWKSQPCLDALGIAATPGPTAALSLYPNPAGDVLHVRSAAANGIRQLLITDVTGRLVSNTSFSGAEASVAVASWPAGLYTVTVHYADGTQAHQKFIKQ